MRPRRRWLLAQPGGRGTVRGEGCPMADPAMREGDRLRDRQERDQRPGSWAIPSRSPTRTSPPDAWFFADQPPATYDPAKAIESSTRPAGGPGADGIREKDGLKAMIELCTTTRQVRQDTLALIADWLKDVGIQGIPNAVAPGRHLRRLQRVRPRTRPVRLSQSNFDLAEHAFSSSIDPIGNYFSYHSSQFEPNGANDAQVKNAEIDARWTRSRTAWTSRSSRTRWRVPEDLRRADARDPALLPQEGGPVQPEARQLLREPDPGRPDVERRRTGTSRASPTIGGPLRGLTVTTQEPTRGAPSAGAPTRYPAFEPCMLRTDSGRAPTTSHPSRHSETG